MFSVEQSSVHSIICNWLNIFRDQILFVFLLICLFKLALSSITIRKSFITNIFWETNIACTPFFCAVANASSISFILLPCAEKLFYAPISLYPWTIKTQKISHDFFFSHYLFLPCYQYCLSQKPHQMTKSAISYSLKSTTLLWTTYSYF